MRFVYHGTNAKYVKEILKNGIQTRENTGFSNWSENKMDSIKNHVYLTRLYGLYFGMCAVENLKEESVAVFKIDLDKLNNESLYPDEDYIEQGIRYDGLDVNILQGYDTESSMPTRMECIRNKIENYQSCWFDSLKNLGNISHKGHIPSKAIKSVSIINAPMSFYMDIDPTITIQNAMYAGNKYHFYNELIFGKEYTAEDVFIALQIPMSYPDNIPDSDKKELIESFKNMGIYEQQKEKYEKIINGNYWTIKENKNYDK